MRSSTKQLCSPNSRYIHHSRYHTHSMDLEQLLIQEYDQKIVHLYHPLTGAKEAYDSIRSQYLIKRETSCSNDIGRLEKGVGTCMKTGNKNIFFIPKSKVPSGINITYSNPVWDYCPRKYDPYRIILTIGGDKLNYS